MKKNILQYLEKNAIEYPNKLSYADLDKGYSWSQLLDKSKHVGSYVAEHLEYGKAVLVYMKKSSDMFPAFFGAVGERLHIGFDDPDAFKGTEEEMLAEFRRVRDEIKMKMEEFYLTKIKNRKA